MMRQKVPNWRLCRRDCLYTIELSNGETAGLGERHERYFDFISNNGALGWPDVLSHYPKIYLDGLVVVFTY